MQDSATPYESESWIRQTELMLNSFATLLGRELIERIHPAADAESLFNAEFVVVSHGTQDDPLLNYANQAALELWSMPLEQLIGMPSRKTAEPVHRAERSDLLRRTSEDGFIDDYSGIRITSDGRRFRIHQAIVWNINDEDGNPSGQAATFSEWTMLQP